MRSDQIAHNFLLSVHHLYRVIVFYEGLVQIKPARVFNHALVRSCL